jgi:hypothetical protein
MNRVARIQVISAELQGIKDGERAACQPCAQIRDALNARREALDAELQAHEGRECQDCAEVAVRRGALFRERLDLLAGW